MVGGGDGSEVVADIRTDWPAGEVEANAHLISSAPEMYDTLRDILRLTEDGLHEASLRVIAMWTRQTLAHAEGRELGTASKILKLGEGMRTIDLKEADKCEEGEA